MCSLSSLLCPPNPKKPPNVPMFVLRFLPWTRSRMFLEQKSLVVELRMCCDPGCSGGVLRGEAGDPSGEGEPFRGRHCAGSSPGLHRRSAGGDAAQRAQTEREEVRGRPPSRLVSTFSKSSFSDRHPCCSPGCRAYGVVSMCIGTGMGAAAVFEYPGP